MIQVDPNFSHIRSPYAIRSSEIPEFNIVPKWPGMHSRRVDLCAVFTIDQAGYNLWSSTSSLPRPARYPTGPIVTILRYYGQAGLSRLVCIHRDIREIVFGHIGGPP
jgi:hypothetical protein